MELVEFTEEYKTGIDSIDYEHQKLINYMNEIIKASEMGDTGHLIIEINLDELISYTVFHFKNEEELLLKLKDPNYESHKQGHEKLKEKVMSYKKRFDEKEDITTELIGFLKDWLFAHIKGTDFKYVENFKKNNII